MVLNQITVNFDTIEELNAFKKKLKGHKIWEEDDSDYGLYITLDISDCDVDELHELLKKMGV